MDYIDNISEKLITMVSVHRYEHSVGVQQTAIKLAELNGVSNEKASIAGLVHDCAKGLSGAELINCAAQYDIEVDSIYRIQPELLHGPVGAFMAKEIFNISDNEVLHAVKCHTTGCVDMSKLDKIIYLADYIEPGRDFPGVSEIREMAYKNLDRGVLMALDSSIKYIVDRGWLIDLNSINARNYLLENMT